MRNRTLTNMRAIPAISGALALCATIAITAPAAHSQPYGGIVGVMERQPMEFQPGMTRGGMTAVMKEATQTVETQQPFVGSFRMWVDRADRTYEVGASARVYFSADQGAFVQLFGISKDHVVEPLFPPDKLNMAVGPRQIQPGRSMVLPEPGDGFYFRIDPPSGVAMLYGIVSSSALPREIRTGLYRDMAKANEASGLAGVRAVVIDYANRFPEWRMKTVALPYEIQDRRVAADAGQPPPIVRPADREVRPAPALPWLRPPQGGRPSVRVKMDAQAYTAGDAAIVTVRTETPCNLAVFAMGSHGGVDMLFPNAQQPDPRLPAGADLTIGGTGTGLRMHVRGTAGKDPETERLVAFCMPAEAPPLTRRRPDQHTPTLTFRPGSVELSAMDALRDRIGPNSISEVIYQVGPSHGS